MTATQAALPFETPTPLAWADAGGTGFEIGWDHAHHRLTPPVEHLQPGNPIRHGWEAGKAAFGARTLRATPSVRKWLQLRCNAWLRGRAFDAQQVTPAFLARIAVARCPITREALTQATGHASDASVDRVNNDAGYAVGNLAVMSVRANRAKAAGGVDDALACARRIEAARLGTIGGLEAPQWSRLAVLTAFATPLPHARAATLPLLVLPPPRLYVINPAQALQAVLTLQFTRDGYTQRIAALAALMPGDEPRRELRTFMHTLLARRIAAGPQCQGPALREALEDLWRDPLVLRRWQRLVLRLDAGDCERIVQAAERRGLIGPGVRWLPEHVATEGWSLASRGYVAPHDEPQVPRVERRAHARRDNARMPVRRPSSACPPASAS